MNSQQFKPAMAVAVLMAAAALHAEHQPFTRYQSIVDRQMFGPLPAHFDPMKMPNEVSGRGADGKEEAELTKEQEQVKSAIRFSVINLTPQGDTVVGFSDNSDPKAPVHYYLKVGEKRNGWEVKAADAVAATMTIAKGDVEVTLSIGGDSSNGGAKNAAGTDSETSARPGLVRPSALGGIGLQGRRSRRREEREKQQAELARQKEERDRQDAEKEAERNAEREEQRNQLNQIQEQLRKEREEREKERKEREEREERDRAEKAKSAEEASE